MNEKIAHIFDCLAITYTTFQKQIETIAVFCDHNWTLLSDESCRDNLDSYNCRKGKL